MGRLGNIFQKLPFQRSKIREDYLLALDIGTEFVKALVLQIERDFLDDKRNQGVVIGVSRQRQVSGNMLAGAVADIDGVTLVCKKAIDQASQMAKIQPQKAVIGVAGEFVKGATTNFLYQRSEPQSEINLAEIQNIIQKIQWRAFNKMRGQLANETCRSEIEIKPINALLTEVRIDGYQVTNPLGFQGKEIFLSIFNVYAPLVHLRAIEKIAHNLELDLLSIVAESYALTKALSFNPRPGAVFIDVGGGTTDIALVRQGKVEGIKSLSLAGCAFTKRLGQMFNLDLPEAEEIKIRHAQQRLGQGVQKKISEILEKDIAIWLRGVELVLEEFDHQEILPAQIFLCGGGSLLPGIFNILKRRSTQTRWLDRFPFEQMPRVNFIHTDQIHGITDQTQELHGPESITPLALAGLALEVVSDENKVLSPVLRRLVRIMR